MIYILSKLGWDVLRPSVFLLLLSWAGITLVYSRRSVFGWRLLLAGLAGYLLILLIPLDTWALLPLEDRFSRPAEPLEISGIVVLSGAIDTELTKDRGIPSLNAAAERMTEAVALARRYPEARLVFTGASSHVISGGPTETEGARRIFLALGIDPSRLLFEEKARNTYENALNTVLLVQPKVGERWLLITSARHQPRAIGVFRRVGWPVTAWPVSYKSGHSLRAWMAPSMDQRLSNLDAAAHEWAGLLAYWLMGRTDTLFPAPDEPEDSPARAER